MHVRQPAQAVQCKTETKHPVYPKESSVGMVGRCVEALHVIQGDRRVDHETEQARANQIPEQNRGKEHERPMIVIFPEVLSFDFRSLVRFKPDDHQRHDLQRRERGADSDNGCRRSAEIEVVECSKHTAEQENDRRQEDHQSRRGGTQNSHADEKKRNDCGCKNFENAFNPEMDHPPTPVLHYRDMRVLPPHQAGGV